MEHPLITAVTHSTDEARVTLLGVPDVPGIAGRIFGALAEANVNVDMIIQNEPESDGAARRHVVHRAALRSRAARATLDRDRRRAGHPPVATDVEMGKVSIVGRRHAVAPGRRREGLLARSASSEINIEMISTSPIKISCVIRSENVPSAVRALHSAFELGDDRRRARSSRSEGVR